jgi:hypothetical protein
MGHPNWKDEIEDNINLCVIDRLKYLVDDLGVLSVLIYMRLFNLYNTKLNGSKLQSNDQLVYAE